jgi:energy-coupling factor transport system substrate-specific component
MSAPVIVALFGGITGSGASLVVAFLLASGNSVIQSVVLSGLAAEPLDKTIQVLLALWLLRGVPGSLLERFRNDRLTKNGLLD